MSPELHPAVRFRISLAFAVLLFCLAPAGSVFAQQSAVTDSTDNPKRLYIGVTSGVTVNYHSGGFRAFDDPRCPISEDGSGTGYLIGVSSEYVIDNARRFGIIGRATLEQRPGTFSEVLPGARVIIPPESDNGEPQVIDQDVSLTSDVTYPLFNVEALLKFTPLRVGDVEVGVVAGPAVQFVRTGNNIRSHQDLDRPENGRFANTDGYPEENGGRRLILRDDEIPASKSTRVSAKLGAGVGVRLLDEVLSISAGAYYDAGLTKVTDTEDWTLNSFIAQLDVRVGL